MMHQGWDAATASTCVYSHACMQPSILFVRNELKDDTISP